jgi:hypothetical protein
MPRRSILSAAERDSLFALPDTNEELIRHYTFNETDLAIIRQHRGPANRLGFAVQLCYMRYPGIMLGGDDEPSAPLLHMVAAQLSVSADIWGEYAQRAETRREHLLELQTVFGFQSFTTMHHYRPAVHGMNELACQTDKGVVLATELIEQLRRQAILSPTANVIERICAEAITRANRRIYESLTDSLTVFHFRNLTSCSPARPTATSLGWPGCASPRASPIRGTCSNTSNASRRGRCSTSRPASSARCTRIACSRSPARAGR